jgi:hypothetical protein
MMPSVRQPLMLCFVDGESCDRGKGTLGDRNADKNNTNHGESLVFAATGT